MDVTLFLDSQEKNVDGIELDLEKSEGYYGADRFRVRFQEKVHHYGHEKENLKWFYVNNDITIYLNREQASNLLRQLAILLSDENADFGPAPSEDEAPIPPEDEKAAIA